jgi:hypothetical protein
MAMRSATIAVDAELAAAYNAAPKTSQKKALSAMRRALQPAPTPKTKAPRLSKKETELFLKINRGLSEEQRQRLDELNEKIEESVLTDEEHAELLSLAELVERISVERLRAIIDLAKLRKVPPEELMQQLGIEPSSDGR